MITSLQSNDLDIAVGLTEGFVKALGNQSRDPEFRLVGTYVESPLCWAISTGAQRELYDVEGLNGKRIGVSRIGRLVHTGVGFFASGGDLLRTTTQRVLRDELCAG